VACGDGDLTSILVVISIHLIDTIAGCPILADPNRNTNTRGTFIFGYNSSVFR